MTALDTSTPPRPRKEFGDFQTPPGLVSRILELLGPIGARFDRVLEPTCGRGHFLAGILEGGSLPREAVGVEIQAEHAEVARGLARPGVRLTIESGDLFRLDLARDLPWVDRGPLLVVGNLPWVTAADVGASGGTNGPERSNARGLRGLEALTGSANFDLSEAIWIKLIRELEPERPTIALLCKLAVARAVLRSAGVGELPVTRATIWKVDAPKWFRASVEACLLRVEVGPGPRATEAEVFADLSAEFPGSVLGFEGGRMIADLGAYRRSSFLEGPCPLEWRQGVKHDAVALMELVEGGEGRLRNGIGEVVDIEPEFVFPLLKGTDLGGSGRPRPRRSVIVTQRRLGDDTRNLESLAPRLWTYLDAHRGAFERRKSAIYRGRPPFAMFGIGDYSFAPFKVAVSGLHKSPKFRAIGSSEGVPTMLDDTCYFLPCRSGEQASTMADALNGPEAQDLLRALTFRDAKRPITKAALRQIDLRALLAYKGVEGPWLGEWGPGRTS